MVAFSLGFSCLARRVEALFISERRQGDRFDDVVGRRADAGRLSFL